MPLTIELAKTAPPDIPVVAVGIVAGQEPAAEDDSGQVDLTYLATQGFTGERGDVRALPRTGGGVTFAVGLGPAAEVDASALRQAAGSLARAARRHPALTVDLAGWAADGTSPASAAQAIAEGLVLGGYRYTAFKSEPGEAALRRVALVARGGQRARAAIDRGVTVAEAVCWARDLENEPGGSLTPTRLAEQAVAAGTQAGFEVTVWDQKRIRKEKLGGLLGVNRGSEQAPRFLRLEYAPDGARSTVALVGKGITFDSGGLSLKPAEGMVGMKGDMGGAAAVLGAFRAVASLGAKVRVIGFLPITDNMTGGDATRVGDVLTTRSGTTVEVLNTDAEGRLVLADALALACEERPAAIVDLATLTGACMVALGHRIAGLMGNHQGWQTQVRAAADAVGEPVWPLPLPTHLRPKLDSEVADLKNVTDTRDGGALAAGLFLQEFVSADIPWVHLDIAGPADSAVTEGELVKGGTGFGVRTLVEMLSRFVQPKPDEA
jgi:leucyl aminopeptidase